MRKTSVPTFVLVGSSVIAAVMLLLGYLNRTNDHLMITATLNDTTLNASQVLVDDELPMNYDATTHHQFWTGGGVLGLSEGDENVAKDAMSAKLREAFIELFHLPMAQFEHRHISRVSAYSVTQFRRLFMSLAAVNNNSDCLVRMDPFKQLQCYMWAEKLRPLGGGDGAAPATSALFSGLAVDSMCSLALSCSVWKRGRYQRRLTPAYLRSVFNGLVHNEKLLNSSQLLLRNVVHGGDNWREYEWLNDRLKVCEAMVLESNFTTTDIDARALFQGGDITTRSVKDSHGRLSSLHLATRDNGGGQEEVQLTRTLTALETMSVLHHKATGGQHRSPQWIVYPATSTQKQCRTTAINMLLFTGDSIGRQFFRRLVDVLRRSSLGGQVSVPYGSTFVNTSFRHWPSKDYTDWQDMVLAIYPTHDELHVFDSLMSFSTVAAGSPYKRTSNTVNAFFENAVAQRRRHRCGDDGESNGPTSASNNLQGQEEPIFYLVHLFDAITSRPRTDGLAPCLPLPPLSDFPLPGTNSFSLLKRAATLGMNLIPDPPIRPFRALGIRIPLHVHNSNMWERDESATTSDWLTKMAVNCSVEAPNVSLASAVPEKKGIRWLADGDDWTVGVHPSSDITHLYRVSTQLRHTEASMRRLRVSPHGHYKQIAARQDDVVFLPTHSSLTRLATPFLWLRNTTAAMRETQQRRRCGSSQPQGGVFFSQVRVLDMGKMMLASGNVFHTPDRLHENCIGGVNWLEGAASYNASARPILGQWSRDITKLALALIKERANVAGYDSNFAFEPDSGCGALGTLETINALLLDIVDSCRGM